MYHSRYHFSNNSISIALDSMTGEVLELMYNKNGDNLIKNSSYLLHQPFVLYTLDTCRQLFCANAVQISDFPESKATITQENYESGDIKVIVSYEYLTDGQSFYHIPLTYTIYLPYNVPRSLWSLHLCCMEETGIGEIRFPQLNGLYLGETYEDNTLVYPYNAGIKLENPVRYMEKEPTKIYWKWQEYRYVYTIDSFGDKDENDLYVKQTSYAGPLSMTWLDYYNPSYGLYFACHDPSDAVIGLRVETYGVRSPGMNFAIVKKPVIRYGDEWKFESACVQIHDGDWHRGADIYRAFRKVSRPEPPEWFLKSPGLIAHYDFKYQNGGVVHHYKDIPRLLEEAKEMGINHLLLAGWHKDGFDNGFPEYVPDGELGTQEELEESIHHATKNGGHICFYVNSRIANMKYPHLSQFIHDNVTVDINGKEQTEGCGNEKLKFALMCSESEGWQNKIAETADYLLNTIGADGIYLDQLSMAPPSACFHSKHNHISWNAGNKSIAKKVLQKENMSLIIEGVSDLYGSQVSGQLISTFMYYHTGAFPELYKYTFPEQILVDMLYPKRNLAMRPVHVANVSTQMINKAFVIGSYFWIYDLEEDNTFFRDEKQLAYLKSAIVLRRNWLEKFGHGIFLDNQGITITGSSADVKRYRVGTGILLAASSETCEPVTVRFDDISLINKAFMFTADKELRPIHTNYENSVTFTPTPLSIIYIPESGLEG